MSKIALSPNASGTGTLTIAAPNTNSDRTLTLPDSAGTIATAESTLAQFNASGSAPVYACRAWVNFNGTGTVAIRASGNVSSITDGGVGQYTVNFTNAMPDVNYAVSGSCGTTDGATSGGWFSNGSGASYVNSNLTTSCRVVTNYTTIQVADYTHVSVAIFR